MSSVHWIRPKESFEAVQNGKCVAASLRNVTAESSRISVSSILSAFRVYDVAKETPLDPAPTLSDISGNTVLLKREDLQPVFSFKLRGAYNKIASLSMEERKKGVVTCSAGNHAQGVAFSARHLGLPCVIFMPTTTPDIKIQNVRRLGGEVLLHGNTFDEAYAKSVEFAKARCSTLVHPFDDVQVMAGQGTIGMELLKQYRSTIDAVFIPVGGGGILGGVGSCLKALSPNVKVIGVEAQDSAGMTASLNAGFPVTLQTVGPFADGTAVKTIGSETFKICYNGGVVDEMLCCTTDEICAAIKDGFNDLRVILEPSGALAIAGLKKYVETSKCRGKVLIALCTGANMDFDRLRFVSERADTSEVLLSLIIPEEPGSFRRLHSLVFPRPVTEFSYQLSDHRVKAEGGITGDRGKETNERLACYPGHAYVMLSYRPTDAEDARGVETRLLQCGYEVKNLQNSDLAKDHCRYLTGGRSTVARFERLFRFEFPQRPTALKNFLGALSTEWNISLFHYRNHGSDVGRVLIGLQVPPAANEEFDRFLEKMRGMNFDHMEETDNPVVRHFLRCNREEI